MVDLTRATGLTEEVSKAITKTFAYQPWDEEQKARGERVRDALAAAVAVIIENVPPGPNRSTAIRKVIEARMDCNLAITTEVDR